MNLKEIREAERNYALKSLVIGVKDLTEAVNYQNTTIATLSKRIQSLEGRRWWKFWKV